MSVVGGARIIIILIILGSVVDDVGTLEASEGTQDDTANGALRGSLESNALRPKLMVSGVRSDPISRSPSMAGCSK
jgi:hypothetical protein